MYNQLMGRGAVGPPRRFDENYRCYPIAMLPGPDRENLNYGGKVLLPPSALDKLTRLHITYPMLFELVNGHTGKKTHAGVLEFVAEEGKIYLPFWMMQILLLEPGDLLQVQSTDLPSGQFVKLQPQNVSFLEISDPKAVLENAFRNYACLTKGDIFAFSYNDEVFEVAVLEVKPAKMNDSICVIETDMEVDFAAPVGYVEPERTSGTSTPRGLKGAILHTEGSMAKAINYTSIAPNSTAAEAGAAAVRSHFLSGGQRLVNKKGKSAATPPVRPSTPATDPSSNQSATISTSRKSGPQPLRLKPGQLFFGYEIKPLRKKDGEEPVVEKKTHFQGAGQTLRPAKGKKKESK